MSKELIRKAVLKASWFNDKVPERFKWEVSNGTAYTMTTKTDGDILYREFQITYKARLFTIVEKRILGKVEKDVVFCYEQSALALIS